MVKSPTTRSLELLRRRGFRAGVVERWNVFENCREGLFGIFDIVAVDEGGRVILGVKTALTKKLGPVKCRLLKSDDARRWLAAGGRIHIHGWRKQGRRWTLRLSIIDLQDLKDTQAPNQFVAKSGKLFRQVARRDE